MVPFKKVPSTVKGIEYLPSFGIGAMMVTAVIVAAYFAFLKFVSNRRAPSSCHTELFSCASFSDAAERGQI